MSSTDNNTVAAFPNQNERVIEKILANFKFPR